MTILVKNAVGADTTISTIDDLLPPVSKIGTRAYSWEDSISRTISSSSAQTAAVGTAGEYEISTDIDCYISIGTSPTAVSTDGRFLAAGSSWTIQLVATDKIAVIRKSIDGNLFVLPVV